MNTKYAIVIFITILAGIKTEYEAGKPVVRMPMNVMYFKQVEGEPNPMSVTGLASLVEGIENLALYLENPGECMEPAKSYLHVDYLLTDNQCLRSIAPCWIGYTVATWFKMAPKGNGHFEGGYLAQVDSYLNFSLAIWESHKTMTNVSGYNFVITLDTYGSAGKLRLSCPVFHNTSEWAHLAFTANESISEKTAVHMYYNGQAVLCHRKAIWSNTTLSPYTRNFNIGCSQRSASLLDATCYCGFNGYIDEFQFYDQELPAEEVNKLYQLNSQPVQFCEDKNCSTDIY